jgi:DNA repair exonuclease SbcCD nuclease subunit
MKARQAGELAPALRRKRLETARTIMELARTEAVDAVLLAGDTFEDPNVERSTFEEVRHLLESVAPIPVLVLPGNHDPLSPGGIWDRPIWLDGSSNVLVLRSPVELEPIPGCAFYPCPLEQKHSIQDPTRWIPKRAEGDDRLRVGIAHGSLPVGSDAAMRNFPIPTDRAQVSELDYLALGDWHGMNVQGRTAYSGTPEQTSFADKNCGYVLLVDIPNAGTTPTVNPVPVGCFQWVSAIGTVIREKTDVEDLRRSIEGHGDPSSLCLDVSIKIAPSVDEATLNALDRLKESLANVFWLTWSATERVPTAEAVALIPDGTLREVYEELGGAATVDDGDAGSVALEARRWMLEIAAEEVR